MGMDTVELIMKIEDYFQIRIPDQEAEQIFRVQDIYDIVVKHLPTEINQAEVKETINKIIADHAGLPISDIEPQKSITTDLGLD